MTEYSDEKLFNEYLFYRLVFVEKRKCILTVSKHIHYTRMYIIKNTNSITITLYEKYTI